MKFFLLTTIVLAQLMPPTAIPVHTKAQIEASESRIRQAKLDKTKRLEFKMRQVKNMLAPFQKANPDIPISYVDYGDSIVIKICVQ